MGRYAQMLRMAHASIARNAGSLPTMLYVPLDRIWSVPDTCPGEQWTSWCPLGVKQFLTLLWQLCALLSRPSPMCEQAAGSRVCPGWAEVQDVLSCHMPQTVLSKFGPPGAPWGSSSSSPSSGSCAPCCHSPLQKTLAHMLCKQGVRMLPCPCIHLTALGPGLKALVHLQGRHRH